MAQPLNTGPVKQLRLSPNKAKAYFRASPKPCPSTQPVMAHLSKAPHWETVIGLEVHVQLDTCSKAFCGDATTFGAAPNTQTSPVSLGHPGTLPRLNEVHIRAAIKLGLALGATIASYTAFDRKNYFYTDLPKGYQITQDATPICRGGTLHIKLGDTWKPIRIHHIHMEEDAGKSIHDQDPAHTLIDLNRAGVPLLEIVTEPDLRSADEVDACMSALRQLVRYLGISDGNMEQGNLRCDVNISVRRKGSDRLGTRCEVKNLNSMRHARRAIAFERQRQIALLEAGQHVARLTLYFDAAHATTSPLRDKEAAHDYRYFPEPDLPPLQLQPDYIEAIRATLPPLPRQLYEWMRNHCGLSDYDATLLTEDLHTALFFQKLATHTPDFAKAANLIINRILPWCKAQRCPIADFPVPPTALARLIAMVGEGLISHGVAWQELFSLLCAHPDASPDELALTHDLIQQRDESLLRSTVEEVVAAWPDKVAAYRKGKKGLFGFFMGQIMRRTAGKADPKLAGKLLQEKLTEK